MERPLAKSRQESDGQKVEKTLEKPRETVLGRSISAGAMADLDLADLETSCMGQYRKETVQLTIDSNFAQHLTTVELESAVMIVQTTAGQATDHPVENPARIDLVPGVVARFFPSANHVVTTPLKLGQKPRDLGWIVLQIAVEREHEVPASYAKGSRERGGLAEVAPKRIALTRESRSVSILRTAHDPSWLPSSTKMNSAGS